MRPDAVGRAEPTASSFLWTSRARAMLERRRKDDEKSRRAQSHVPSGFVQLTRNSTKPDGGGRNEDHGMAKTDRRLYLHYALLREPAGSEARTMKNDYKISRALRDTVGSYTCANASQ